MSADLIVHPVVVRAIGGLLFVAGIPAQERGDGVADVQVRVLRSLHRKPDFLWPKTVESMKGLSVRCTLSYLIDRQRKATRRRRLGDVGVVVENPDDHEAQTRRPSERHPLDLQKVRTIVRAYLEQSNMPAEDARILEGLLNDEDQAQIGKEIGLSHQQVRDRVRKFRTAFRIEAAALGAGALAVFLFLRALGGPHVPRYYPHAEDVALKDASPQQIAADLRERARPSCRNAKWAPCLALLNAAADLDPDGDGADEIQAVRDRAQSELEDETRGRDAKTGLPLPTPKSPRPQAPVPR